MYRKNSFDNWDLAINTLESWNVLLPEAVATFRELKTVRNHSIHFNPETDKNYKEAALNSTLLFVFCSLSKVFVYINLYGHNECENPYVVKC